MHHGSCPVGDRALSVSGPFDVDFAIGIMGVHRIEARTAVDNVRSNVAMSRLGARKEGVLRGAFVSGGRLRGSAPLGACRGRRRLRELERLE